ncbi:tetratricopeptide (TPR) repeat protein [Rhodobium gokarnense]|uniref:Tetratricopeptide (TPR) repeat protein n=1 Tax=Rhodobium gokarnense TaxID=364296 RepID=A0ABT3H7D2_9HYPH|nr:tetratricopeptide (TPR) repeat protein [Rhodobium gokarnense]
MGGLAWVGAGVVGNSSYQGVVGLARATGNRLGGLFGVPEGDDIARAVRRGQLAALERTIRDYWKVGRPEWQDEPHTRPEMFHEQSLDFCKKAVGRCRDLTLKVNDDLTPYMVAALDGALAARTGTAEAAQDDLATLTEDAVLDELCQHLGGVRLPDGFEDHFRQGSGQYPRFMDAFGAFITREFRDNDGFHSVFIGGKLAAIEGVANDAVTLLASLEHRFGSTLERIDARTDRMESDVVATRAGVEEVLAILKAGGVLSRAEQAGITVEAVRAIAVRLFDEKIADVSLLPSIEKWIDRAQQQLGQQSNEGDAFEAARREAERRFREGCIGEASRPFMEELEREERQEQEHQEERRRKRSRLLEEAIRFDELAFDPSAGVAKLLLLAENESIVGAADLSQWLVDRAKYYRDRGETKGDNAALLFAIAAYRAALEERTRERVPLDWAATQNNLGNALGILGARESGTERLKEAVDAYRAALKEWTRERAPLQWAAAQNNQGNVLRILGQRESGRERLQEAVDAYRAALEEWPRERAPIQWATAQNNLGNALSTLGERESGTERLKEAVTAYRAALEERTRERVPLDWAMTQNNLGTALRDLGERESGTERLKEAVAAYRAALEELTRERVPLDWAATQDNLGNALKTLGERESSTERLEGAAAAYRAALEERTRERVPLQWAATQNNLGNVLSRLGERESGTERLNEAVDAYRVALKERTRERVPLDWAMTQNNLGTALATLGRRESSTERLEEAVAAYCAALEEWTSERVPLQWAGTQNNLGAVLATLGEREIVTARLEEAVAAFRAALEVFTVEEHPLFWKITTDNLNRTSEEIRQRSNDPSNEP